MKFPAWVQRLINMARARNIKPGLFKNEVLGEADPLITILFIGLWCLADRDGKLEDRPKRIKAEIFPYRELPDFNRYLTVLQQLGFIDRYSVDEKAIIQVIKFNYHQSPHKTEKDSELPDKPLEMGVTEVAPLDNGSITEVAALIPDSLIPDSLIPDSLSKGTKKRFVPPTHSELQNYINEKNLLFPPDDFIDHFTSNGWKVGGKAPMKDWKAAARRWAQRQYEFHPEKKPVKPDLSSYEPDGTPITDSDGELL